MLNALKNSSLLSGADDGSLDKVVKTSVSAVYKKGEKISAEPPSLVLITEGRAVVKRADVTLNTLKSNDFFGAAQLFGQDGAPTAVIASAPVKCIKIPQSTVEELLKTDYGFTKAYITFLSGRIRFLNKKIVSFTSGNGEKTLANYILSLPRQDDGTATLPVNMAKLASSLNISRATLYRAITSLENKGIIEKNGSAVRIISAEKLKNI